MAYETFAGKDATGAAVNWIGDAVTGGFILTVKIDAGADGATTGPVSTTNPLPVTLPGVSASTPLAVREPVRGSALNKGAAGAGSTVSSVAVVASNGARTVLEISNASGSGIWLAFGSAAVSGSGTYLPAKATGYWYTTAAVNYIVENGGTPGAVGYTEW
jgi:hypothetical protein